MNRLMAYVIVCVMIVSALPIGTVMVSGSTSSSRDSDNSFATANVIKSNDYMYHDTLTGIGDVYDFFKIQLNNTGANAERLLVNATNNGGGALRMNIYEPDQYWIASDPILGNTAFLKVIAESSGWYYIQVEGQGPTFPYTVWFHKMTVAWTGDTNKNASTAKVMGAFPYTAQGAFDNVSGPNDFYKVHLNRIPATSTDILMINITPPGVPGQAVVPEVYYASNNTGVKGMFLQGGTSVISPPRGYTFTMVPVVTADYLIRIWGWEGAGNYGIKVIKVSCTYNTNNDQASAVTVLGAGKTHSDTATGTASYGLDDSDYFKFAGKQGMHINATLTSLDYDNALHLPVMYLHLLNQSGREYAEADLDIIRQTADPMSVIEASTLHPLPDNETYYLWVEAQGGAGQFRLNVTANTPPQAVMVPPAMFIWENGTNNSLAMNKLFADFDGDTMTYSTDTNPNMTVTIDTTTTVITFKPKTAYRGHTCSNLTATDTLSAKGTLKVCADVHAINHAPFIKKYFNATFPDGVLTLKFGQVYTGIDLTQYFGDPDKENKHWFNATGFDTSKLYIQIYEEMPVTPDHFKTGLISLVAQTVETTEHVQFFSKDNGYPNYISPPLNLTVIVNSGEVIILSKLASELKITENTNGTFPVKDYIYFKPPPPPDDTIAWTSKASSNLTVKISTDGIATITPDSYWCGSGTVTFTGTGTKNTKATNSTTLKVTVTCVHYKPEILDTTPKGAVTMAEGSKVFFKVTARDLDMPHNILKYTWFWDNVIQGSTNNSLNFLASFEMAGIHNLTVKINSTYKESTYTWRNITVTDVNRVPDISTVHILGNLNNTNYTKGAKITLQASQATDPDKDTVQYKWYDNNVQIGSTQKIDYKIPSKGLHVIKLEVSDTHGGVTSTSVNINVKEPKKPTPGFEVVLVVLGVIVAIGVVVALGRRKR